MNYNPKTSNKINTKKSMLEYLKIMEWKLIDMFTTPSVVRKISNASCKVYDKKNLNEKIISGGTTQAEAILDSFRF